MLAGLAVDLDSTAAKALMAVAAALFVPGALVTYAWMRTKIGRRSDSRRPLLAGAFLVLAAGAHAAGGPVVVIDAGHDRRANAETEPIGPGSATRKVKDGGGTSGVVTRIREADLVLDVSVTPAHLAPPRRGDGRHDADADDGESMGNIARARIANRAGAALFLRVHADGHPDSRSAGRTRWCPPSATAGPTTSTGRAAAPQRRSKPSSCRALGFPDRGIQERSDFTGFNWADVPVILVELGFMTHPGEDRAARARRSARSRGARALPRSRHVPRARPCTLRDLDKAKNLG